MRAERAAGLTPLDRVHDTHWLWVETHCADDSSPREPAGMEIELHVQRVPQGLLLLSDEARPQAGCAATTAWRATASVKRENEWRLEPRAHVALPVAGFPPPHLPTTRPASPPSHPRERSGETSHDPPDPPTQPPQGAVEGGEPLSTACAKRPAARRAEIRASERVLELIERTSPRCGGLDARAVYRRIRGPARDAEQLLRHYVIHYNRRDAEAVAALFAERGSLVEPFGAERQPTRHDGGSRVRAWYARALGSVPWVALRAVRLEEGRKPGHYTLFWKYMDPLLQRPLRGRNRFVLAAGEIFEAEIELLEPPRPSSRVLTPRAGGLGRGGLPSSG